MRAHKLTPQKTTDLALVLETARGHLKNGASALETLRRINDEYLSVNNVHIIPEGSDPEIVKLIADTDTPDADKACLPTTMVPARILLSCDRASRNHQVELASECNGVVIDPSTWRVLSYPPAALSFNMPHNVIIDCLKNGWYTPIVADFGTVMTLYFKPAKSLKLGARPDAGSWVLSTANGYEIDNKIWMGTRTFRELVDELFEKVQLDIDQLDKNWCYSFGMHHPDYHPFNGGGQDPIRGWFIRAVHLGEINTDKCVRRLHEIPDGTSVDAKKMFNKLPGQHVDQEIINMTTISPQAAMQHMLTKCKEGSIRSYIADRQKVPCYGYVLISRSPEIISSCLLESDLMAYIRRTVCQRPPREIKPEHRFNWMLVRSSFDISDKDYFRTVFPQASNMGELLDNSIRRIASRIVDSLQNGFKFDDTDDDKVVKFFRSEMTRRNVVIDRKPESVGIVQNFIQKPDYARIYIKLIG